MSKSKRPLTKREAIREKRRREQRLRRLILILGLAGVVLVVTGLLIVPNLLSGLAPLGEIVQITPKERPLEDGKTLGDPNAPVLIETYVDFQCVACESYALTIEPFVIDNHVESGEVYYVFRHFPILDARAAIKESHQAAYASMCASEQGRFWDYHDMLFANLTGVNQGAFSERRLIAFAEVLELDVEDFEACLQENRYVDVINDDITRGQELSVQGTPSIFVNNQLLTPGRVPTYQEIRQAIEFSLADPDS